MAVQILVGHVIDRLRELPDESVHMCVTSPPYWGLRDYGTPPQVWGGSGDPGWQVCVHEWGGIERAHHPGQVPDGKSVHRENAIGQTAGSGQFCLRCGAWRGSLGLEPPYQLYVEHIVGIMREVRRVLRKDGTLWLNLGDSYAGSWGAQGHRTTNHHDKLSWHSSQINNHPKRASHTGSIRDAGLKPKDLVGIPWRVAFALQDEGWYLRKDIILGKRAPMPESCNDRPTSAHEHLFLLTKAPRYFYDRIAVQEEFETDEKENYPARSKITGRGQQSFALARGNDQDKSGGFPPNGSGRNMRDVWWLSPSAFPGAHFATFSPELPRRAILAGTSERGVCPKCGAPWARITESAFVKLVQRRDTRKAIQPGADMADINSRNEMGYNETKTIGWQPTCSCDAGDPISATCLDPFLGAGTTALVADRLGRHCIGIELSEKYARMAEQRLREDAGMFLDLAAE